MLDMGFVDDIEAILAEMPKERQSALFSATFPPRINALVKRHLNEPERITITAETRKRPRDRQPPYLVPRPPSPKPPGRIPDPGPPPSPTTSVRPRTKVD